MGQHTWCGVGASTTLISLSFYAHYSASIHFLPKLFGTWHLFVILNIQCKFRSILWEFIFFFYQNSSLSLRDMNHFQLTRMSVHIMQLVTFCMFFYFMIQICCSMVKACQQLRGPEGEGPQDLPLHVLYVQGLIGAILERREQDQGPLFSKAVLLPDDPRHTRPRLAPFPPLQVDVILARRLGRLEKAM